MTCLIPDWVPRQFAGLDGVGTVGGFKSYILPINPAHSLLCFANCPMPASALNIQIWYNWLSSSILVNTLVNMRSVLKQAGIYKVPRCIYLSDVKYHYDRSVGSANHLQLHHLYQPGAGTGTNIVVVTQSVHHIWWNSVNIKPIHTCYRIELFIRMRPSGVLTISVRLTQL